MSFEERMEQLGRRSVAQEPTELALPRCIRAAECVKPVSCVKYRVEKHGFGEGRLPIPGIVISDKNHGQDASRHLQDSPACRRPAHRTAGKVLRPSQQQAAAQLDAIKARMSAAKAFSAEVERKNAEALHSNRPGSAGTAAALKYEGSQTPPPPNASRQHSDSQKPLVERHKPYQGSTGSAVLASAHAAASLPTAGEQEPSSSATEAAASTAAADKEPPAAAADMQPSTCVLGSTAVCSTAAEVDAPMPVGMSADTEETFGQAAASAAAEVAAWQFRAGRTSLTEPFSAPSSPCMRTGSVHTSAAEQAPVAAGTAVVGAMASPTVAAAASTQSEVAAAGDSMQALQPPTGTLVTHGGCDKVTQPAEAPGSDTTSADTTPNPADTASLPAASHDISHGSSTASRVHHQSTIITDPSSRLLHYAQATAGGGPGVTWSPTAAAVAADHSAALRAAGCGGVSSAGDFRAMHTAAAGGGSIWIPGAVAGSSSSPRRASSPVQRPGSPCRRAEGPHWSPVPPRTQLRPPAVVKPMAAWFVDQEPLQEVPAPGQQQHSWQQIQQPLAASSPCRPPWQGVQDRGDAPASDSVTAEVPRGGGSRASRRTSVASIGPSSSRSRHSVDNTPAAAFINQHLAQLAAAAAEKVAKRQVMLPALCSCGHGTSVLDASYPNRCCSNCPLRGNAAVYEQLLTGLLAGMGLK